MLSNSIKRGVTKGLASVIDLIKIMAPVYIAVSVIGKTPLMGLLDKAAKPIMGLMGLPGEAATALVIGNVLNIYAAIGAIGALHLTTKQVTVLALAILISHNLFVETAVSKKTGIKVTSLVFVRVFGGILSAMLLNWGWH